MSNKQLRLTRIVEGVTSEGKRSRQRLCPFCARSDSVEKRRRRMVPTGSYHKHIMRHHSGWIKDLWEHRQYVKLLWFAKDIGGGPYGDYLFFYAAQGLAGEGETLPEFRPEFNGNWRTGTALNVAYQNMPYPAPRAGEPVSGLQPGEDDVKVEQVEVRRCGICFDPLSTVERWVNLHDDVHPFCLDCLDAMIANEVNRRLNEGLNPVITAIICPICRQSVRLNVVQEAMTAELMRGRAQAVSGAVGAPLTESLERIIPYRIPAQRPTPLRSTGWIQSRGIRLRNRPLITPLVEVTVLNRSLNTDETLDESMSTDASGGQD